MFDAGRRGVPAAGHQLTAGRVCGPSSTTPTTLQTSLGLCRSGPSRLAGSFARGGIGGWRWLWMMWTNGILHTDRASLDSEALRQIASIPVTNPRARPWRSLPSERRPAADQFNLPLSMRHVDASDRCCRHALSKQRSLLAWPFTLPSATSEDSETLGTPCAEPTARSILSVSL
jgi:hypothetical protein